MRWGLSAPHAAGQPPRRDYGSPASAGQPHDETKAPHPMIFVVSYADPLRRRLGAVVRADPR